MPNGSLKPNHTDCLDERPHMTPLRILFATWLATAALGAAHAQSGPLFTASSKAQGASFDLMATETERLPGKSYLQVPGFHERTAAGARWLMCAYTALAVERGFSHWFVLYPPQYSTRLVVGLTNEADASPEQVLGSDFSKERLVGGKAMPVERMTAFCNAKR